MLSGLREKLLKDWRWKLCALGFGLALWFYCMNVTGATVKTDTITVLLTIENQASLTSEDLVLQNESELKNRYIQLQVRGRREDIDRLKRDTSKIKAYIDLGWIELRHSSTWGERQSIGVYVDKSPEYSSVEVINKTPPSVGITLDKYEKDTFEVKVVSTGSPAENYTNSQSQSVPAAAEIWGARSTLQKISRVAVNVDIEGQMDDVTLTTTPVAYDVDGNEVGDIEIRPAEVDVSVSIDKLGRMPILQPSIVGEPPASYVITDVNWEPTYAEVMGSEEAINNMGSISLDPVDVSSFTSNQEKTYDLWAYLPNTLQIVNRTPQQVTVTFKVERLIEKQLALPISALTIRGYSVGAAFTEETIPVTIQAIQSVIGGIEADDIIGTVDLTGLTEGVHTVPITLRLPTGVTVVGTPPTTEITISGGLPPEAEDMPESNGVQGTDGA